MGKIEYEKQIVEKMVRLYCRLNHTSGMLCSECAGVLAYAHDKLSKCPFKDEKTTCSDCTVHCYQKDQRENIRRIMRFSGPRMLIYHPKDFFLHMFKK